MEAIQTGLGFDAAGAVVDPALWAARSRPVLIEGRPYQIAYTPTVPTGVFPPGAIPVNADGGGVGVFCLFPWEGQEGPWGGS